MSWESYGEDYDDNEENNSMLEMVQQQQKFRTHNVFGIHRRAVVATYVDALGVTQNANSGSPFYTNEVLLKLPKNYTKNSDNGSFAELLQVENSAPCSIPRGSIIEKVAVWRKNRSKDIDPSLKIVMGYYPLASVSKDTKDFYSQRIFSKEKPLSGNFLQLFSRYQRCQRAGLEEFLESLDYVKNEYKAKEKREFPDLDLESMNLKDEVGEPFDLRPVICIQSGFISVADIGISISYSPSLTE